MKAYLIEKELLRFRRNELEAKENLTHSELFELMELRDKLAGVTYSSKNEGV